MATVGKLFADGLDGSPRLVEEVRVGFDERSVWVPTPRDLDRLVDPTRLLSRFGPGRIAVVIATIRTWAS